jgi:hypothetical protein
MGQFVHRPSVLCALAGLAVASAAHAQSRNWLNPVSGNWSSPANWSGFNVPDTNPKSAFIGEPGGYTVYVDGNFALSSLFIPGTAPGAQVAIGNGRSLSLLAIDNSGTITVGEAGGAGTSLRAQGGVSIVGAGAIVPAGPAPTSSPRGASPFSAPARSS